MNSLADIEAVDVSVVIVLYNCEVDFVSRLVYPIYKTVREFIIVLNSPVDINKLGVEEFETKCKFIKNQSNLGIAEAQNIGVEAASGNFILFFDQDSCVCENFATDLVASFVFCEKKLNLKIGLISALDFDEETGIENKSRIDSSYSIPHTEVREVSNTLSSGSLIRKNVFSEVEGNDSWMFIDLVDNDLCFRLKDFGYMICLDPNLRLIHNLGEGRESFLGMVFGISSPFRNYYQIRNIIYLISKRYVKLPQKLILFRSLLVKFVLVFLFLNKKGQRLKYMVGGLIDGLGHVFRQK